MFGRTPRATVASGPLAPVPTGPVGGLVNGWAPFGSGQHASSQIGAYNGVPLNQYPANIPGVQLHSGREWGNPGYYYPSLSAIPNGSIQQTQYPANLAGGQRNGQVHHGALGPLSARGIMANVVTQQVRQSGATALGWAAQLSGGQALPPQVQGV